MSVTARNPPAEAGQRDFAGIGKAGVEGFGRDYRNLIFCVLFFAIYIAIILLLQTETARRTTAPPWYSWTKLPAAKTRLQVLWLLPPAAIYVGWVLLIRGMLVRPLRLKWLLPLAWATVTAMNVAMAMVDGGPKALWKPFDRPGAEYFYDVPRVHGVRQWLRDYVPLLPSYTLHTRTHPPGAVLFLYAVAKIFGSGIGAAAIAAIVFAASAVIPALLLARRLGGEQAAIIFLGLYAVTPNLVLFGATSMDGVFLPVILWSGYFLYRAIHDASVAWGCAAGFALVISIMLTFATVGIGVLFGLYAMVRLWKTPSLTWKLLQSLAACAMILIVAFVAIYLATGFNLIDCLFASRHSDHYVMKTFSLQVGRYLDISFDNLFAFLIGVGLISVVFWWQFLMRKNRSPNHYFQWTAAVTIVVLSFAGLFTHETERIWMFFSPIPLLAAADLLQARHHPRAVEWTMGALFLQTWLCQIFLYTMW